MSENNDLYRELGVPPDASATEIKAAYRKKSRATHPDTGGNAAEFAKLSQAYAVLSVPEKRRRYDAGEAVNVETPATKAQNYILKIFAGAMEQGLQTGTIEHADLIAACRKVLEADGKRLKQNEETMRTVILRLEKALKRLKRKKGDGPDLLTGVLRQKIDTCHTDLKNIANDVEILKLANELLDAYEMPAELQSTVLNWGAANGISVTFR